MKAICLLLSLVALTLAYDIPPSILEQPEMTVADMRVPMILYCRADGTPEPTYYWEKNGVLVDVSADSRMSLEGGNLKITALTVEDNGVYQCFANNRLGTAISQKINASVAYMNQFEDTEKVTKRVQVGQSLRLRCGATYGPPESYPRPTIFWSDSGEPPLFISYDARINQEPDGTLVFSNVIAKDAMGYQCNVFNSVVGQSQRSPIITLEVNSDLPPALSPPSLVSKPAGSEIAIRTEKFVLKCIAYGYPTPAISWKKGEEQLESGERISIEQAGLGLVISSVENTDKGTYTCIAENSEGSDEFSTVVSVESAPYFPAPPSDETKGPGESVDIECRAEGVPSPIVTWLVNGQPWDDFQSNIDASRWTVVSGNPKLATISITNLQTTDSNVFQCIATNKYREDLTSVVLNVVSIPARIPSFVPQTRKLKVLQGESATLVCHVEGRPTPIITWIHKATELTNGPKYTISSSDVEGRLVVNDAVEADSGNYECTASNSIDGQDYSEVEGAQVTVLRKTTISITPVDATVREGETATFQCEIDYDHELDEPEVYWIKEDDSSRFSANEDGTLTLPDAHSSDTGTYTCVVLTTVDESADTVQRVEASASLIVRGRPEPPMNVELRLKEDEFHQDLLWEAGFDNFSPITHYIIQYDTKWSDMHWRFQANETASSSRQYRIVVQLQPYVEYKFRVIAVNEMGESQPSYEVAPLVAAQMAAPTRNPVGVRGSSTSPDSIVIRWEAIHPFYYNGDGFYYEVAYRPTANRDQPFLVDDVQPENTDSNPTGVIQTHIVNAQRPYEEFEFSVRSVNSEGPAPDPQVYTGFSGEAEPSAAPSGVAVNAISANEVNVTWEPIPPEDANGQLGGYNVYYNVRIGSGVTKQTCVQSPCIVGNLQAATTYEVYVVGFTSAGEGPASQTVYVLTDSAPPGPVHKLKIQPFSYRIELQWHKPTLPNGVIEGYKVKITPVNDDETLGEEAVVDVEPTEDGPVVLRYDQVNPDTKYRIQVLAVNDMGDGEHITEEPTTSLPGKPSKPPKPDVSIGTDHANFTWDVSNLNPTVQFVRMQYKKKDYAGEYTDSDPVDVLDETQIMVTGLESSTTYTARLRVTNPEGSTVGDHIDFKTTTTGALADDGGIVLGTWMIILICIIILLILILLIICIVKSQKGGKYNVSDKEKALNKDIESTPLKDDGGFDEYKPPTGADGEPLRGSQGSLNDSEHGSSETDSLKEYADGETGKFDEEGSFIGQYGDNKKQRQPDEEQGGGAAYSTFV